MAENQKTPVSFRIGPEIKGMAEQRAKELHRTLTSYIEWLILEDTKRAERTKGKAAAK